MKQDNFLDVSDSMRERQNSESVCARHKIPQPPPARKDKLPADDAQGTRIF